MNSARIGVSLDIVEVKCFMSIDQHVETNNEAAILARMIHPERADLPGNAAQALLQVLKFDQADLDRMHELAVKNQDDNLKPAEKTELETYIRISYFIDLMHAKARLSLKNHC